MENIERIEAKKHIFSNLDREEGSAGVTTYRKYLSLGPFLSSPINKVYLVDIIPVCLCIIWTHCMNTCTASLLYEHMYSFLIIWTHLWFPCYMNTCTTSLLYEHVYDFLVTWTHVWVPCYMNTSLHIIWTVEHMYDFLSISVVLCVPLKVSVIYEGLGYKTVKYY